MSCINKWRDDLLVWIAPGHLSCDLVFSNVYLNCVRGLSRNINYVWVRKKVSSMKNLHLNLRSIHLNIINVCLSSAGATAYILCIIINY